MAFWLVVSCSYALVLIALVVVLARAGAVGADTAALNDEKTKQNAVIADLEARIAEMKAAQSKALFTEMRAAGVDLEDQAAIDRFIAVKNAILAPPLPARAVTATTAAATPTEARVTRSPTRWSPAPGERWPAPTDPCGCGSGRRFKKCCMPR